MTLKTKRLMAVMACLFSSTTYTQNNYSGDNYYYYPTVTTTISSPQKQYCPPSQRFDVGTFPPRCFDCPRVVSNRMQVMRIGTTLMLNTNSTKRPVQKFSPGLPQNQTCGCWTAPANQTFDVVLNASWIVTGLVFSSERARWLREFDVHASNDSKAFMPWGAFIMPNFTAATYALFTYPIRAQYFRITVRKYANHYTNFSTGFLLTPVQALVSIDQPFSCACPTLSSGACCPFVNMTVRNDECVWCMDPGDIMTRVIDGCGKCKPGTFEHAGKCYQRVLRPAVNSLSTGNASSDGTRWSVDVNFTHDLQSAVQLFVTRKPGKTHPCVTREPGWASDTRPVSSCCVKDYHDSSSQMYMPVLWNFTPPPPPGETDALSCSLANSQLDPPNSVKQFVQFDRGRGGPPLINRYTLSLTEAEIRQWTTCDNATLVCTGYIGALFATAITAPPIQSFLPQLILQPLRFELGVPPLVCSTQHDLPALARAEVHYYATDDTYTARLVGVPLKGEVVRFQWTNGSNDVWFDTRNTAPELTISRPPLGQSSLRITDSITTVRIDAPIAPVVHGAVRLSTHAGILVEVKYGFGFSAMPSPGDTDQIVIITAKSTQPARLKRLATVLSQNGQSTVYTNSKGFISDPKRLVDLVIACYQDRGILTKWLLQALQLLDTEGLPYPAFIERSCRMVLTNEVAKAFWLVPYRGVSADSRTAPAGVDVIAEFA